MLFHPLATLLGGVLDHPGAEIGLVVPLQEVLFLVEEQLVCRPAGRGPSQSSIGGQE